MRRNASVDVRVDRFSTLSVSLPDDEEDVDEKDDSENGNARASASATVAGRFFKSIRCFLSVSHSLFLSLSPRFSAFLNASTMLAIFFRSTPREQSIKDEVSTMIDEYNCK